MMDMFVGLADTLSVETAQAVATTKLEAESKGEGMKLALGFR